MLAHRQSVTSIAASPCGWCECVPLTVNVCIFRLCAAFDKEDALFLRDKEREQRHQEQHKRDVEAAAFAAARARSQQLLEQQAAAKLRQQDTGLQQEAAR